MYNYIHLIEPKVSIFFLQHVILIYKLPLFLLDKDKIYNPSNQIMLRLAEKGMELAIDYERYKDSDPPLRKVRELINRNLSEYGISFRNAKPVIV